MKEFCICAAIKLVTGEVIYGHRHNNCYDVVSARPGFTKTLVLDAVQGFVTSRGRFVGREEAMKLQRASGKPSKYSFNGKYCGKMLFSEDLY